MRPSRVSAVIPTRGGLDLTKVIDSLIFDDIVIWDNSAEDVDEMTHGRTRAFERCRWPIVYSQDDDIVHSPENQLAILAAYRPDAITGCMWQDWSEGARKQGIPNGYEDLVFMGSGSVFWPGVPLAAADRYLAHYPLDDFFRLWSDTIIGILAPTRQLDLRFEEMPWAVGPTRMADLQDGPALKGEAIRRAREIRDQEAVAA